RTFQMLEDVGNVLQHATTITATPPAAARCQTAGIGASPEVALVSVRSYAGVTAARTRQDVCDGRILHVKRLQ
ncbi:MAG TPA: hypothetical protein VMP68_29435, partial [Candidatus Eisenbacteria bacterium]|nr:hypothetical protein [Candidatus Eisenbacteria bacterium]